MIALRGPPLAPPLPPCSAASPRPAAVAILARRDLARSIAFGRSSRRIGAASRFLSCRCSGGAFSSGDDGGGSSIGSAVAKAGEILSLGFPVWVSAACAIALFRPSAFEFLRPELQIVGITLTMLGMGITITLDDLKGALLMPKELLIGFVLQYTVMPFSGYMVAKLLKLPSYYAAGLILVSCCPGGTASNIVTYLARGNVALSVLMTAMSTFASVVITPLLASKLVGQYVTIDPVGIFLSTIQVVLAPVVLGAGLNQYCKWLVGIISPIMPFISVATVAMLCGRAIAQNAASILGSGLKVAVAAVLLHASGFFFGYVLSRWTMGVGEREARTISIEVGMQNSVLGVVLAGQHLSSPLAAVPCAVSSVCHSVAGSMLAGVWRSNPTEDSKGTH
ncbi:putative sodium/metabolite cotransporter BASS1, chloroplastic [Wolffia australiana]